MRSLTKGSDSAFDLCKSCHSLPSDRDIDRQVLQWTKNRSMALSCYLVELTRSAHPSREAKHSLRIGICLPCAVSHPVADHGPHSSGANAEASIGSNPMREDIMSRLAPDSPSLTIASAMVSAGAAATWLEGNPKAAIASHGEILAIGFAAFSGIGGVAVPSQDGSDASQMRFELSPELFREGDSLHFAFLDSSASEVGFESLSVQVRVSSLATVEILSLSFDDANAAEAALDDAVYALAPGLDDSHLYGAVVNVLFSSTRASGDGLTTTDFALIVSHAVAEPSALVLVALVALSLALRARSVE